MTDPAADQVSPWYSVTEAADRARRHEKTILTALRRGNLRGYQSRRNATWRIHVADLDAWVRGEPVAAERSTRRPRRRSVA